MNEAVKAENLTKFYGKLCAVDHISFVVEKGEIFGFLGPNGAGKTTTLKVLLRIIFPTRGNAWILDQSIGSPALKRRIGYMPENPYFYRFLTGEEFLGFYARLAEVPSTDRRRRINELLHLVGLEEARKHCLQLSILGSFPKAKELL